MANTSQLRCPKCGREFKMPAHLARHMSAGHGDSKPAESGVRGRIGTAPAPTRPVMQGRPKQSASGNGLAPELAMLKRVRLDLVSQREQLSNQIVALDRAIAVFDPPKVPF